MSNKTGKTLITLLDEQRWLARSKQFESAHRLAGIFRGWIPEAYFSPGRPRILYVGKATSGEFDGANQERDSFNGKGKFWSFARQIATKVGCPDDEIPCIAWSNVSKISVAQIVAEDALIDGFEEDATSTLESEIATTNPHVIVFVTLRFGELVVRKIANGIDDASWNKSENESNLLGERDIWWKRRSDGTAVLWMQHPMIAKAETLNFATNKVASLLHLA